MNDRSGEGAADQVGRAVDVEVLRETLRKHPVDLAVLFGSTVTGSADPGSDVVVVVEFSGDVERRTDVVMDLLVDISVALDRNDVDLSVVEDLKPRVGLAAFEHGELLVGDPDRAERHRKRFARAVDEERTEPLRDRFDHALDRIDRLLEAR